MSRKSEAKKARRKKRRAGQDARWISNTVLDGMSDDIELAAVLEGFDERITERGWMFHDELSDEESALWFYPQSQVDQVDDAVASATTILMTADDGAEVLHVVFVGTADDYEFELEELFSHLDAIEAYRLGEPVPEFSS